MVFRPIKTRTPRESWYGSRGSLVLGADPRGQRRDDRETYDLNVRGVVT